MHRSRRLTGRHSRRRRHANNWLWRRIGRPSSSLLGNRSKHLRGRRHGWRRSGSRSRSRRNSWPWRGTCRRNSSLLASTCSRNLRWQRRAWKWRHLRRRRNRNSSLLHSRRWHRAWRGHDSPRRPRWNSLIQRQTQQDLPVLSAAWQLPYLRGE